MNEICKHCGREIDWCNCVETTKDGKEKPGFEPSGLVAVPKEFVEAVKRFIVTGVGTNDYCFSKKRIKSMLAQMKKEG